jgi:hypothetical protein
MVNDVAMVGRHDDQRLLEDRRAPSPPRTASDSSTVSFSAFAALPAWWAWSMRPASTTSRKPRCSSLEEVDGLLASWRAGTARWRPGRCAPVRIGHVRVGEQAQHGCLRRRQRVLGVGVAARRDTPPAIRRSGCAVFSPAAVVRGQEVPAPAAHRDLDAVTRAGAELRDSGVRAGPQTAWRYPRSRPRWQRRASRCRLPSRGWRLGVGGGGRGVGQPRGADHSRALAGQLRDVQQ